MKCNVLSSRKLNQRTKDEKLGPQITKTLRRNQRCNMRGGGKRIEVGRVDI